MYKYENIKKVFTYVPSGLLEEENEATIIKWALQFYNSNIRISHMTDDILSAIIKIENHKGTIPVGFKTFIDVGYSEVLPNENVNDSQTIFLQPTVDGEYVTIFQRTFWQFYKQRSNLMRYVGKDASIVDNDCVQYLCDNCVNFSIDKTFRTITLDVEDGYVFMLYSSTMKDDENNFMVIDHPLLWQAMAHFVEAKHFQERAFRKEEGTNNMYLERLQMANKFFGEFQKYYLLSNYNPDDHLVKTQRVNMFPSIQNQLDRTNYKR